MTGDENNLLNKVPGVLEDPSNCSTAGHCSKERPGPPAMFMLWLNPDSLIALLMANIGFTK